MAIKPCRELPYGGFFKIKNKLGKARTGVIKTAHGKILTPGFAFVATHGTIKSLDKKIIVWRRRN